MGVCCGRRNVTSSAQLKFSSSCVLSWAPPLVIGLRQLPGSFVRAWLLLAYVGAILQALLAEPLAIGVARC